MFLEFLTSPWGIVTIVAVSLVLVITISIPLYRVLFKRFYDIILSFVAIILLLPLLLLLMIMGRIAMKGNPFFTQERPGKKEKIFKLIKLRTMTNQRDQNGNLLPDEKRLNKYGKILRTLSLDELPQLFNIFVGHMSIIGPRPLLVKYLPLYNDTQKCRHKARPGLTGLAQVSGRNAISWEQKFDFDVKYVSKISFFTDLKIFFKTIGKVFKRSGISQEGNATMQEFTGNEECIDKIEASAAIGIIEERNENKAINNDSTNCDIIIDDEANTDSLLEGDSTTKENNVSFYDFNDVVSEVKDPNLGENI